MADISLVNLTKFYDKHQTIHDVSLEIKTGEFIVFVGPSGCGKSTLLRMISGLEEISGGELYIDKEKMTTVDPASRGVAMVFQSYALYPHMSVEENMGFGLKMNGVSKELINKRVMVAANTLQMEHLLKRKPKDLSGGQRQRVAIGRAIVRDPKVFLFDEPLSNLDAELRVEMRLQIAKLHNQLKNTMIYVTHDQVEAMTLADRIVVLREGKIEQVGTPLELYHSPVNEFVAGFIGSPKMNFVPCDLISVKDESIIIHLPDGQEITLSKLSNISIKPGEKLTLGIRPEHILIDSQENFHTSTDVKLVFRSEVAERLGSSTYLFGDYQQVKGFKVHVNGDKSIGMFENVTVGFSLDDCHLFDTSGNSILTHKVR